MLVIYSAGLFLILYIIESIPYDPGMPGKVILFLGLLGVAGLLVGSLLIRETMELLRSNSAEAESEDS